MKPKNFWLLLSFMVLLRIVLSVSLSDNKVRSDGVNYLGLSYNIARHFSFTAVIPSDERDFSGGVTITGFFKHFDEQPSLYRRLMNYQWFHALAFLPVIVLFKSLYAIIVVNNLLFFGAGYFLLGIVRQRLNGRILAAAWAFLLFFPPFFFVTNQFYSEPLFIFLLSYIIHHIVLKKQFTVPFFAALVLLSVTRGFGLFLTAGLVLAAWRNQEWKHGAMYAMCGLAAMGLNALSGAGNKDERMITIDSPPSVLHLVYFANTVRGNGDTDYFLVHPEQQQDDPLLSEYRAGRSSSLALLGEVIRQNAEHPAMFAVNAWRKITAYFFNIIPDSWAYDHRPQPLHRKIAWGLQNGIWMGLVWLGLARMDRNYRKFFSILFWISFAAHFIALSRYRYFQPVMFAGIPAAAAALAVLAERFLPPKNNNAPPS